MAGGQIFPEQLPGHWEMWFTWLSQKLESTWKNFPVQAVVCASYHVRICTDWFRFPFSHSPFHEHEPSVCCQCPSQCSVIWPIFWKPSLLSSRQNSLCFCSIPPKSEALKVKTSSTWQVFLALPSAAQQQPSSWWLALSRRTYLSCSCQSLKINCKEKQLHGCMHLLFSWWQYLEITVLLRERTKFIACTVFPRRFSYWECRFAGYMKVLLQTPLLLVLMYRRS